MEYILFVVSCNLHKFPYIISFTIGVFVYDVCHLYPTVTILDGFLVTYLENKP